MFYLGANVPLKFLNYDATGALANATGGAVVTVIAPDASTSTPAVANPSPGTYTCPGPSALAGRYTVNYVSSGTNAATITDVYDVRSNSDTALLSLMDAKAMLDIDPTDNSQDGKIADKLDAVTDLIELVIGYVVPRTVTATVVLSGSAFFLPGPVISITSITPVLTNGWVYDIADFSVESSGLVTRLDGIRLSGQAYTVVYQAGRPGPIQPRYLEAARLQISILWATQRARLWPGDGTQAAPIPPDMLAPEVYAMLQRDRIMSVA